MTSTQKYIAEELKTITRECLQKQITPEEWVARYAMRYRLRYIKAGSMGAGHFYNRRKGAI